MATSLQALGQIFPRSSGEMAAAGLYHLPSRHDAGAPDWTELRDRWENSHLIRAVLGFIPLALLVVAVSLRP